jgi:hypothetical protein
VGGSVSEFLRQNEILFWDLSLEKPTLGGLLTIVTEAHLVTSRKGDTEFIIPVVPSADNLIDIYRLVDIFKDSFEGYRLVIVENRDVDVDFVSGLNVIHSPIKAEYESFSTMRIQTLWKSGYGNPRIPWRQKIAEDLSLNLPHIATVHLKKSENNPIES